MINLLPPQSKDAYRYARRNRHLMHWVFALLAGIFGAILLTGLGYYYLGQTTENYRQQVRTAQAQLAAQNVDKTQKEVQNMAGNLNLAVQVLSKQVLFSDMLKRLGSITPSDAALTTLTISPTQNAIDITAQAKSYDAAMQVQVNYNSKENRVFDKTDVIGITCASNERAATAQQEYPCTINIRALLTKDSPFYFISPTNNKKTGGLTP
jgi:acetyl-CoA acetyltransferase